MAATRPIPPIAVGEHVQVTLPHVGRVPATIEATEPGALVLVLAVGDARVARLGGAQVSVEHATGRGINRFTGTLSLDGAGAERLRLHVEGDAERIQRREWARVEAVLPVTIRGLEEPVGGDTQTLNLSGGGLLVRDPWNMPLGIDVRVTLQVEAGADPLTALGRVVRAPAPDAKGIRIDSIAREDSERLVRLVRERELAALRMARGR